MLGLVHLLRIAAAVIVPTVVGGGPGLVLPLPAAPPPLTIALSGEPAAASANSTRLLRAAERAVASDRELIVISGTTPLRAPVALPAGLRLKLSARTLLSATQPGSAVLRLGADTTLTGGAISNTSPSDAMDVEIAAGAHDLTIRSVRFLGARANALYLNQPGLHGLVVEYCRFSGVVYGVLLNPGAAGASRLRFAWNLFDHISADGVELNAAPGTGPATVSDVVVVRNVVRDQVGSSPSSGFGVGFSGVADFTVKDNAFLRVRGEAVHLEDETTRGVVSTNIVTGGGNGQRPALAIYRSVSHVRVHDNVISGFNGSGIETLWDPQGSSSWITVDHNAITRVRGRGIVLAGDAGSGPFIARDNRVLFPGGVAIGDYGTHASTVITGNVVHVGPGGLPYEERYRGQGSSAVSGNWMTMSSGR